ncbi:hypothetical protein GCM10007897_04520 [Sphingobium jiangsuense]|uniref:4-carboxy-2-hydroxymuconate-6-semialdehyde dehydrogenase-like C-terminal domain-containing protein n=1 Tax=Sphingobium jiangsuense TaxID=870476 RepID=A0A7W6FQ02_9SPHN|nr:hypothetical protein [Sphingobium jiangsuense]GLS99074.1 hypothetical protein GCM10007897_04520 [Sphingobium jiangsuense]
MSCRPCCIVSAPLPRPVRAALTTYFFHRKNINAKGEPQSWTDDLLNGKEEAIDVSRVAVSMNGIELQNREFVAAIRESREPNASVAQVLSCYRVPDVLEKQLDATRDPSHLDLQP